MRTSEDKPNAVPRAIAEISYIVDYERCEDLSQLNSIMETINRNQYQLISVTQDSNDIFTVFFRRCVIG